MITQLKNETKCQNCKADYAFQTILNVIGLTCITKGHLTYHHYDTPDHFEWKCPMCNYCNCIDITITIHSHLGEKQL